MRESYFLSCPRPPGTGPNTRQDGACAACAMSAGPRALAATESADATTPLSVFMHTNRAVRPGAKRLGFELRTGWWAETHDVAALRRRLPKRNFPYHWQVTLHQSFKVSWLLGAAKGAPEPWVLADTDTIFQQCDAAEVPPVQPPPPPPHAPHAPPAPRSPYIYRHLPAPAYISMCLRARCAGGSRRSVLRWWWVRRRSGGQGATMHATPTRPRTPASATRTRVCSSAPPRDSSSCSPRTPLCPR